MLASGRLAVRQRLVRRARLLVARCACEARINFVAVCMSSGVGVRSFVHVFVYAFAEICTHAFAYKYAYLCACVHVFASALRGIL